MSDRTTAPPTLDAATSTRRTTRGSRATRSSCGSRASRRCRSTPPTSAAPPSGWPTTLRAAGRRARRGRRRPAAIPSSTATGSTPRARRRSSSTATTTSSRSTRSTCGPRRRSSRSSIDGRMLARGAADDKGQIHAHVDGRRRRSSRHAAASRSTSSTCSRARRRARRSGLDGWLAANQRPPRGRRRDHQRHGLLRGQPPGDHGRPARADVRPDRRRRLAGRPPLGRLRRAPSRTRPIALAQIIAALKGPDGRIRIPGFYDDVVALDRRGARGDRRAAVRRGGLPQRQSASPALVGEAGYTTLERRATRPTLDVNGIWGGFQGDGLEDDHPGPRPRQGQLPAGGRPGPRRHLREVPRLRRWRSRRPGVDGHASRTSAAGGRASRRSTIPSRRPPPARSRRRSVGRRVYTPRGRLDPGRGRASSRSSACRSCCSGFTQPHENAHAPERVDGPRPTTRGRSGPSSRPSTRSPRSNVRECRTSAVRVGDIGIRPVLRYGAPHRAPRAPCLRGGLRPREHRVSKPTSSRRPLRATGASTPTTAAWRRAPRWTSSSTSTSGSRPATSPSTSRSRSASPRSTRRSAPACAPAS